MSGYEIRPLSMADILSFGQGAPKKTVCGYAVDWNGEIACIAGITLEHGHAVIFSDIAPGIHAPKITVWRAALDVFSRLKNDYPTPLLAHVNNAIPGAEKFLTRLGFGFVYEHQGTKYYRLEHEILPSGPSRQQTSAF